MKIPKAWIEMADKFAAANGPVKATRTAILRVALGEGLDAMSRRYKSYRVDKLEYDRVKRKHGKSKRGTRR